MNYLCATLPSRVMRNRATSKKVLLRTGEDVNSITRLYIHEYFKGIVGFFKSAFLL